MKKSIFFTFTFFLSLCLYAQETKVTVLSENQDSLIVRITFGEYSLQSQTVNNVQTVIPNLKGTTPILEYGAPDLSKLTQSIRFPKDAKISIEILEETYEDIQNVIVTPSKGNVYRNIDPENVPYEFGKYYRKDHWYPKSQVEVKHEYQIRDVYGCALWVYPFRVLPTHNTLRVYNELILKVIIDYSNSEKATIKSNRAFNQLYEAHFLNQAHVKYDPVSEEGKMLIISDPLFIESMQAFSDWKTQIGIENEIVDVTTIGGASEIKEYVQNYYDTNGLTYLLFVGDHQQVPADNLPAGYSDNSYSYVSGDDHYPDIFVGRFSAEDINHVETMVSRTIDYELNPALDNSYKNAVGIGSEDGTSSTDPSSGNTGMGDDNEADWHHNMNIKEDLLGFTYASVSELYEGGPYPGSLDESGNPSSSSLSSLINDGIGLINYTGHGSSEEFVTTGFDNDDIDQLTNSNVFPFIFSVACVNGEFMNTTCFAEKWLRATDEEGNPTGAIATMMSTINQSWNPPMSGQDEMNDILTEQYESNIRRSFGAIGMQGCMQMNDDYGDAGFEMTDTWLLFGDPSVVVRTDKPENALALHDEVIPLGTSSLTVLSDNEDAIVALTYQDELVSEGLIEAGQVVLAFDPILEVGEYTLTLTAFNSVPYVAQLQSIVLEGPYIIGEDFILTELIDGNDGQADFGDTLVYSTAFENVGIENTSDLTVNVSTENPFISLLSSSFEMSEIPSSSVSWANEVVSLVVSNNVPNGTSATINFEIIDTNGNIWNTSSIIDIFAPEFNVLSYEVDDALGNGNQIMEVGESFYIEIPITNIGGVSSDSIEVMLSTTSPYLMIEDSLIQSNSIESGATDYMMFLCSLSDLTPTSEPIDFQIEISSGMYQYSTGFTYTTSNCEIGFLEVSLNLTTDYYSEDETSMTLLDASGTVYESYAMGELLSDNVYSSSYCIAPGTVMQFTLLDDYGDGINAGGSYSISVCNEEFFSGGDEDFYELVQNFVVSCDQSSIVFGCMDEEAFNYNSDANYDDGSCIDIVEGCTDDSALNYNADANTDDGSCAYTLVCDEGFNEVYISILTDEWGSETSWLLETVSGESIASVSTDTYDDESEYNYGYCVPENEQITFTIMDSYGDGLTTGDGYFSITVCENILLEGADFGTQDQVTFLGCEIYNVGIDEMSGSNWEFYPNPNSGTEFCVVTHVKTLISIYNVLGELVFVDALDFGKNKLSVPSLDTGIYYLQLETGSVKKMIVH